MIRKQTLRKIGVLREIFPVAIGSNPTLGQGDKLAGYRREPIPWQRKKRCFAGDLAAIV